MHETAAREGALDEGLKQLLTLAGLTPHWVVAIASPLPQWAPTRQDLVFGL